MDPPPHLFRVALEQLAFQIRIVPHPGFIRVKIFSLGYGDVRHHFHMLGRTRPKSGQHDSANKVTSLHSRLIPS
jgi:hypothetical protein